MIASQYFDEPLRNKDTNGHSSHRALRANDFHFSGESPPLKIFKVKEARCGTRRNTEQYFHFSGESPPPQIFKVKEASCGTRRATEPENINFSIL